MQFLEKLREFLVLTNFFRNFISHRSGKTTQIFTNKPVYLGLSLTRISKIVMYKFCPD